MIFLFCNCKIVNISLWKQFRSRMTRWAEYECFYSNNSVCALFLVLQAPALWEMPPVITTTRWLTRWTAQTPPAPWATISPSAKREAVSTAWWTTSRWLFSSGVDFRKKLLQHHSRWVHGHKVPTFYYNLTTCAPQLCSSNVAVAGPCLNSR